MKISKKVILSLVISVIMGIALVLGVVGSVGKATKVEPSSTSQSSQTKVYVPNETKYTFNPEEVKIQRGGSQIDFSYEPGVEGKEATTIAYEYTFNNPMSVNMGVNLKQMKEIPSGVTVSYGYGTTEQTSSRFTAQEIKPGQSKKIYIVLQADEEFQTDFQSSVVWYQGKYSTVDYTVNGMTAKGVGIVGGQPLEEHASSIMKEMLETVPVPAGYYFDEWYKDEDLAELADEDGDGKISSNDIEGNLYARFANLPKSCLKWDAELEGWTVSNVANANTVDMSIPTRHKDDTHNGLVKRFAGWLLSNNTSIKTVDFPYCVEQIGDWAFHTCSNLTTVKFPKNLKTIGTQAFLGSENLTGDIDLSNVTSVDSYAFQNCKKITGVKFGSSLTGLGYRSFAFTAIRILDLSGTSLTSVGQDAFRGCSSMTSLTLSDKITVLEDNAFDSCSSLTGALNLSNVTSIGASAFVSSKYTSVTFGSGLTSIGSAAFKYCSALKNIDFGNTKITSIPDDTFRGCYAIYGVNAINTDRKSITIGKYAFDSCKELKYVDISPLGNIDEKGFANCVKLELVNRDSDKVLTGNTIGVRAFENCASLQAFCPSDDWSSIKTIGDYAFSACSSFDLTDGQIINNGIQINSYAFNNCTSFMSGEEFIITKTTNIAGSYAFNNTGISSVRIADYEVSSFGAGAFAHCQKLTKADLSAAEALYTIPEYSFEGSAIETVKLHLGYPKVVSTKAFNGCTSLTTINFEGAGDTYWAEIGHSAFKGCTSLTSFNFDNNDTAFTIDAWAFGESGLTGEINLSDVTSIGNYAFNNCHKLTSVTQDIALDNLDKEGSLQSVGNFAFYQCHELKSVLFNGNLTQLGNAAFKYCEKLESVNLVDTRLTAINAEAFRGCSKFANLVLPESVTTIGANAFDVCPSLTGALDLSNVTSIGASAFTSTNITSVTFGENLTSIGARAFIYCGAIQKIDLANTKLTTIESETFRGCNGATMVEFPLTLTTIKQDAFRGCSSIALLDMKNTKITTIGDNSFRDCTGMKMLITSSTLKSIGDSTFYECTNLKTIYDLCPLTITRRSFDYGCIAYYANDVYTTLSEGSEVIALDGVIYLKNSDTSYAALALQDTTQTSLTLHANTTSISSYAFKDCDNLTNVDFSNCTNLTAIGDYAFYDCDNLTSLDLANCTNLKTIGSYAFYHCDKLSRIVIPEKVTSIGDCAFQYCYNLFEVYDLSSALTITDGSSGNGYVGYYAAVIYTSLGESNIIVVDGIKYCKVSDTSYIAVGLEDKTKTSIILHENTTGINQYAFYDCDNLVNVDLSNCTNLIAIESYAFYHCSNLIGVDLSNCANLTTIGTYAFCMDTVLTNINLSDCVNLKTIGNQAFKYCYITSIVIPQKVTSIGTEAFRFCYSLAKVYNLSSLAIKAGNQTYGYVGYYAGVVYNTLEDSNLEAIDGVLYYKESDTSYVVMGLEDETQTNITLHANTTLIRNYAFKDCDNLINVDLSNCINLTAIADGTFYGCDNLVNVDLSNCTNVSKIGDWAFHNCDNLTSVDLTNCANISTIATYAFDGCSSLQFIDLSNCTNLQSIGGNAFADCKSLTSIVIPENVTSISYGDTWDEAFYNCINLKTVYNLSSLNIVAGASTHGGVARYATNVYKTLPTE